MKIWLNGREIKETDRFILCDKCVLNRMREDGYTYQCLATMFHSQGQLCMRGYQYENKV